MPSLAFAEFLELQQALVVERNEDRQLDTLILTEHEPVLTLGRTTKPEHWEPHWTELKSQGIHLPNYWLSDFTIAKLLPRPKGLCGKTGRGVDWYVSRMGNCGVSA
jgi:hypothetical protein